MKSYTKYTVKKQFLIVYIALLLISTLLASVRWANVFHSNIVVINDEINSHISNLSLSMIFYLGIGQSWLLSGKKFRFIIILGLFLIAGNFTCETMMDFMNTTDIIDAIYGTVGITVSFIYLYFTNKWGLLPTKGTV